WALAWRRRPIPLRSAFPKFLSRIRSTMLTGGGDQAMNAGFKIPTGIVTEPVEFKFDPWAYINFMWRHWMFIGATVALALLIGIIYLVRATPRYTAATQILLEQREKAPGLEAINDGRYYDAYSFMENQLAIFRSDSLLRRVVIKERLAPSGQEPQSSG